MFILCVHFCLCRQCCHKLSCHVIMNCSDAMLTLACCFLLPFYRRGQPLLCHPKHTDSLSQSTLSMCSNFEPIIQKKYPVSYSFDCTKMFKCVRFYGRAIDYKNIIPSYIHHSTISYHTQCLLLHFPLNFMLLSCCCFFCTHQVRSHLQQQRYRRLLIVIRDWSVCTNLL